MTPHRAPAPRLGDAERATLLHLLAVTPSQRPAAAAKHPVDWHALLEYVGASLSPLVAHRIEEGRETGPMPPHVARGLRAACAALAALHLRRQVTLRAVYDAFARASIPAIALKGAALAYHVYPDPTLRPMVDIDLWLPPECLDDAVTTLEPLGFRYSEQFAAAQPASAQPGQASSRLLAAPGHAVCLELHGHVRSLHGLPWARFSTAWEAGEDASLGGLAARVLCPEHTLTHLCLHLGRCHAFDSRLLRLVDIALVIQRWGSRWDWPRLARDWRRQRIRTWMLLGVTLARDLLGAPVPKDLEGLGPLPPEWSAMRVIAAERLWDAKTHALPPALGAMVLMRPGARLGWLRRRFFDHYWRAPGPRGGLAVVAGAGRRLWYDLRIRVPKYLKAWRRGALWGPGLAQGVALEQDRAELERLVVAGGDLGYAPDPAAAPQSEHAIAGPPSPG